MASAPQPDWIFLEFMFSNYSKLIQIQSYGDAERNRISMIGFEVGTRTNHSCGKQLACHPHPAEVFTLMTHDTCISLKNSALLSFQGSA